MLRHAKKSAGAVMEGPQAWRLATPVHIVYPQEGENIAHPSYTFQIAASEETAAVEMRIDRGHWQPCREALGLWWYDWSDYGPGEHAAAARLRRPDGTTVPSELRSFTVKSD